jgi:hypothetical protein
MKRSPDKHAILFGGDLALPADADAAGVADDFADHVLGRLTLDALDVRLPSADRPLRDVVRPDVGGHGGRGFAVTEKRIRIAR